MHRLDTDAGASGRVTDKLHEKKVQPGIERDICRVDIPSLYLASKGTLEVQKISFFASESPLPPVIFQMQNT